MKIRIYEQLPCGCYVSNDGGGGLIPCCYPQVGQIETELHKKCMKLYFEENKTAKEIEDIWNKDKGETEMITMQIRIPKKVLEDYAGVIDSLCDIFLEILRTTIDKDIIYV